MGMEMHKHLTWNVMSMAVLAHALRKECHKHGTMHDLPVFCHRELRPLALLHALQYLHACMSTHSYVEPKHKHMHAQLLACA